MKNPKKDRVSPLGRRDLLKIVGATGAAVVATQLVTSGPFSSEAVQGIQRANGQDEGSGGRRWSMAIDLSYCIGCQYCVWACQAVNDVPDDEMRWNVGFPERTIGGQDFYMTRPCFHCTEAPCVRVCPVGATWIRSDGIVTMDYERCIGCRYCEVACPYDVRRFNWKMSENPNPYQPTWGESEVERRPRGVVEKCTFCVHKIDRGLAQGLVPGEDAAATPACVEACPVGARIFGDINDLSSPISEFLQKFEVFQLREEYGTAPNVYYVRPEGEV